MTLKQRDVILVAKDTSGNTCMDYPVTKKANVEGFDDSVIAKVMADGYLRFYRGTTSPKLTDGTTDDTSGLVVWIDTSTTPNQTKIYNTNTSAWELFSPFANKATNADNATNADTVSNKNITDYLPLAGGTMTGPLVLFGAPTVSLNPATKDYVDSAISGIGGGGGSTVIIVGGTISNNGTIPLPSGYTRDQCKYAVWPTAFSIYTYSTSDATPNISVNQTTGKVVFGGNYSGDRGGSVTSAAYLLVGVK